jgi:hypothetical protein
MPPRRVSAPDHRAASTYVAGLSIVRVAGKYRSPPFETRPINAATIGRLGRNRSDLDTLGSQMGYLGYFGLGCANSRQRTTNNRQQRTITHQRPKTNDQRPTTNDQRPTTNVQRQQPGQRGQPIPIKAETAGWVPSLAQLQSSAESDQRPTTNDNRQMSAEARNQSRPKLPARGPAQLDLSQQRSLHCGLHAVGEECMLGHGFGVVITHASWWAPKHGQATHLLPQAVADEVRRKPCHS